MYGENRHTQIETRSATTAEKSSDSASKIRKKYKEIAGAIGVHLTNVCEWRKAYERNGIKGVKIKKRGRKKGSARTLKPDQEQRIKKLICDRTPDQLKLPLALWTRIAVQQLVKQLWKIQMPIRTVGEYLKRWGFTPQKPLRKVYEQRPEAVKNGLIRSIHRSKPVPKVRVLRSTGVMKQCLSTIDTMAEVMRRGKRCRPSAYRLTGKGKSDILRDQSRQSPFYGI